MPESGADPLIGTTIAQYEILAKLGGGGMGVVYKARDSKLGRHVALKFLPSQWSHDEEAKQRFIREAQAASATDHRNICTIHDITSADDGRLFIVMALYEGPTLKQKLHDGPLAIDEALEIATQVAEGLAKAHASGVVHRDLKPGNLIITEDAVKIVDFGLAKFADTLQLTTSGSTLGTAAYMSPEQVRGLEAGSQTDVWAVGVILYEMLAGHPPFRGAYAEAISHAIRTDSPAPLRTIRPDVPEEVEQLVFRALHKDLAVRFATGRELARALRQARGQTMPQDLITQPVDAMRVATAEPRPRRMGWKVVASVVGVIAVAAVAVSLWLLRPVDRVPLLVQPVINQTGDAALDPYRLALTHSLVQQLRVSPTVRVVPFAKMLQALRRFVGGDVDVGSREALQALINVGGANIAALPTLLYEDRAWQGRVEIRDLTTGTNVATYETGKIVSSLSKDTAQRLVSEMAALVSQHFRERGLRTLFAAASATPSLDTLDAEKDFEEGVNWFEEQEYAAALAAFKAAADRDSRNPLPRAWTSRAALVMRSDDAAKDAADRASQLVTDRTPHVDRLFVEAVAAEARGDFMTAESRHRELIEGYPDEVSWSLELAAYHDRRAASREGWAVAVNDYHEALTRDSSLIRPHLELCRLYNRLQESANAKQQGQVALSAYQAAGWRGGEALARFCIVDTLRVGTTAERVQARDQANLALKTLQEMQFRYNLPRALYYVGMAAAGQSQFAEAAKLWEAANESATSAGNLVLQPLLLMNLGVTNERLGNVSSAANYMRRSATLYEQLGDERRAAQQQANSGALRITYGLGMEEAMGEVQNALAVMRKLGDADWEVFCREALGAYDRYAGKYEEAERELSLGLARAKERNLDQKVASVTLALARVSFDRADFGTARTRLQGVTNEKDRSSAHAWTLLGRVHTRLGDFQSARSNFARAESELKQLGEVGLRPQLDVAMGELAYESGRLDEARVHFSHAASWANTADDAVVWGQTYLALLDAIEGEHEKAATTLQESAEKARQMGRVVLEITARVFLARVSLLNRRSQTARSALEDLPLPDGALGMELQASVHYWRGRAMKAVNDASGDSEIVAARKLLDALARSIPESFRQSFFARPDIKVIGG